MALAELKRVSGRAVTIHGDDIDTDRIIPARFLRCVTFDDLGDALFKDERYHPDGTPKDHVLDRPERAGASILVSGRNFGCGSSREHAPQSIKRAGFAGVIAGSFAEIFYGNSTGIGLVCARLDPEDLGHLSAQVDADPELVVTIDVEGQVVTAGDTTYPAFFGASEREALLTGYWDPIGELLEGVQRVKDLARDLGHGGGAGA